MLQLENDISGPLDFFLIRANSKLYREFQLRYDDISTKLIISELCSRHTLSRKTKFGVKKSCLCDNFLSFYTNYKKTSLFTKLSVRK
jgi:hypothetical protein